MLSTWLTACRCNSTCTTYSQRVPLTKRRIRRAAAFSNHTSSSSRRTHSSRGEQLLQFTTVSRHGCWGWCLQMALQRYLVQQGRGSCRRSWCLGGGCVQQQLGE